MGKLHYILQALTLPGSYLRQICNVMTRTGTFRSNYSVFIVLIIACNHGSRAKLFNIIFKKFMRTDTLFAKQLIVTGLQ